MKKSSGVNIFVMGAGEKKMRKILHRDNKIEIPDYCKVPFQKGMFSIDFDMKDFGQTIENISIFSYKQADEEKQRPNLENSNYMRQKLEVYFDTFEGKIGEFIFIKLYEKKYGVILPLNLESWDRGIYETVDFIIHDNLTVQVKTVKHFSNLLAWEDGKNKNKTYEKTDLMFLCRTNVNKQVIGNSNYAEMQEIWNKCVITSYTIDRLKKVGFSGDIVGYANRKMIKEATIRDEKLYPGEKLGQESVRTLNNYIVARDLKI